MANTQGAQDDLLKMLQQLQGQPQVPVGNAPNLSNGAGATVAGGPPPPVVPSDGSSNAMKYGLIGVFVGVLIGVMVSYCYVYKRGKSKINKNTVPPTSNMLQSQFNHPPVHHAPPPNMQPPLPQSQPNPPVQREDPPADPNFTLL